MTKRQAQQIDLDEIIHAEMVREFEADNTRPKKEARNNQTTSAPEQGHSQLDVAHTDLQIVIYYRK